MGPVTLHAFEPLKPINAVRERPAERGAAIGGRGHNVMVLRYFLIGEHIERFAVPGWDGDLYGNGHVEPGGAVRLIWVKSVFPWSLAFLPLPLRPRQTVTAFRRDTAGLRAYLLLWVLSPLVLFTPATNILLAYVLPGLPATAVLLVLLLRDVWGDALRGWPGRIGLGCGLAVTGAFFAAITAIPILAPDSARLRTHAPPMRAAQMLAPGVPVFTASGRSSSAEFYSADRARPVDWEGIGGLTAPAIVIAPSSHRSHPALAPLWPITQAGRYTVYRLTADAKDKEIQVTPKPQTLGATSVGPRLSFVIPAYNQVLVLRETLKRVSREAARTGQTCEILLVEDDSAAGTFEAARRIALPYPVRLIRLSRNFGKEHAIMAGLRTSSGDLVIVLDADLQDNVAYIHDMLDLTAAGHEMVYAVRDGRRDEGWIKRCLTGLLYRRLNQGTGLRPREILAISD